ERQRPADHRHDQPGRDHPKLRLAKRHRRDEVIERRPDLARHEPDDGGVQRVLQRHQDEAGDEIRATIDGLVEGEPEAERAGYRSSQRDGASATACSRTRPSRASFLRWEATDCPAMAWRFTGTSA